MHWRGCVSWGCWSDVCLIYGSAFSSLSNQSQNDQRQQCCSGWMWSHSKVSHLGTSSHIRHWVVLASHLPLPIACSFCECSTPRETRQQAFSYRYLHHPELVAGKATPALVQSARCTNWKYLFWPSSSTTSSLSVWVRLKEDLFTSGRLVKYMYVHSLCKYAEIAGIAYCTSA